MNSILNEISFFVNNFKAFKVTFMVIMGEYPISASFDDQKALLSSVSDQTIVSFDEVIKNEQKRMADSCSMTDIDFEFVLDSSGSIGSDNWESSMDSIAKYWIRNTLKPSNGQKCGNHVAIRRYSSSHSFNLDFTPTSDWVTNGFTNYTEYVANFFENLAYTGGNTDTGGALMRVRTEDIQKTRNGITNIMVFTDGVSTNPAYTIEQAKLLHPRVNGVFAYGIGSGKDYFIKRTSYFTKSDDSGKSFHKGNIDWDELRVINNNTGPAVQRMKTFNNWEDAVSQFVLNSKGCQATIKPYRAVDFTNDSLTHGLSFQTAQQENQSSCDQESVCPLDESKRSYTCVQVDFQNKPVNTKFFHNMRLLFENPLKCSILIANKHAHLMDNYRANIKTAATNKVCHG